MTDLHSSVLAQLRRLLDSPATDSQKLHMALRLLAKYRSVLLQNAVIREYGLTVQRGPFAGMEFADRSMEGCYLPKLLGCYEEELHPHLLAAVGRGYETVLNIGSAEGYYAVGLARLMPTTRVRAYDTNAAAHPVCRKLAERNGVADRVSIGGEFRGEDFERFAGQKVLVFCDIEGGETALLDPDRSPALRLMDVIVELHDGPGTKASELVPARFEASHEITRVGHRGRDVDLPAVLRKLGHLDQLLAAWEWRSTPTPWAVMLKRN